MGKFLLATCQQLKEGKRQRQPFFPGQSKAAWFLSLGRDKKNKQTWKARLPWKVGTSIIHLMNGDLGLKGLNNFPTFTMVRRKGRGSQRAQLCPFLVYVLSRQLSFCYKGLGEAPFFIREVGIDIFFVPLLC